MGPFWEFSQVDEGVCELTAQNPSFSTFITAFYRPFGKLPPRHSRVFILQQHKLIPSLDKSGACHPGLAPPNITFPSCAMALEMGMWPKSSQSGPIQLSHRLFVWGAKNQLSPGLLELNPERYKVGLLINSKRWICNRTYPRVSGNSLQIRWKREEGAVDTMMELRRE